MMGLSEPAGRWGIGHRGRRQKRRAEQPEGLFFVARVKDAFFLRFFVPAKRHPKASPEFVFFRARSPSTRGGLVATTEGRSTQDKSPAGPEHGRRLRLAVTIRCFAKCLETNQGEESGRGGC